MNETGCWYKSLFRDDAQWAKTKESAPKKGNPGPDSSKWNSDVWNNEIFSIA